MRTFPKVPLLPCENGYARLVAQGWDSMQEAFNVNVTPRLVDLLEEAQQAAREADKRMQGLAPLELGGVIYKVRATGTKGFRWQLECSEYLILIASPGTDWPMSIRYLSVGLWLGGGVTPLRIRAMKSLAAYVQPVEADYMRVSRADYCFDFYCPAFQSEFTPGMAENVVAHSSCKQHEVVAGLWSKRGHGQTLTIGMKSSLQVELYDKTREINEASGKTWMREIWARALDGEIVEGNVWRLECRFGSLFLKERNIRRAHELAACRAELVGEALYSRRLCVPNTRDVNRSRWPLHPFWSEAIRTDNAKAMVPLGRIVTGRREALVERSEAQIAGTLLAHSVLEHGAYDEDALRLSVERFFQRITADPNFSKRLAQLQLRYSGVEEPQ